MITTLAAHGFRSLADLVLPLGRVTVITGANGSGKSNIYRAMQLMSRAAYGDMVAAMARDGGLDSLLWAGPETLSGAMLRGEVPVQGGPRKRPVSLSLGFASDAFSYLVNVGLPIPNGDDPFFKDPVLKREVIFAGEVMRPATTFVRRKGALAQLRDGAEWFDASTQLSEWDSVLTELGDPNLSPEVLAVRRQLRSWRFYDTFRVDAAAPARQPQVGVRTPVLADDGADLAPALLTILRSAYGGLLTELIERALGVGLRVRTDGLFQIELDQPGMLRPLSAREFSDGTLRFLLLAAALLSPRPPGLLILNEPETSLHPEVLPAVAKLIESAAQRTQVIVVSHSTQIIDALTSADVDDVIHHRLEKQLGATRILDQGLLSRPRWEWGSR